MLFRFELHPLARCAPFGTAGKKTLHWFALTDGAYWLAIGDDEVFRGTDGQYADYQVVRLWEDVLEILPAVLTPISEAESALAQDVGAWLDRVEQLEDAAGDLDDDAYEAQDRALAWWRARTLYSSHFIAAPLVHFWRADDTMNVAWRSSRHDRNGVWVKGRAQIAMRVEEFVDDVRRFDRALIDAMRERVAEMRRIGGVPGVATDFDLLDREQAERSEWLDRALAKTGSHVSPR